MWPQKCYHQSHLEQLYYDPDQKKPSGLGSGLWLFRRKFSAPSPAGNPDSCSHAGYAEPSSFLSVHRSMDGPERI